MIRTFCDVCGQEVVEGKTDLQGLGTINVSASKAGRRMNVNVHVHASVKATGRTWSDESDPEHLCLHCVIDAVNRLDRREKPAPPRALADASRTELEEALKLFAYPPGGTPPGALEAPESFGGTD